MYYKINLARTVADTVEMTNCLVRAENTAAAVSSIKSKVINEGWTISACNAYETLPDALDCGASKKDSVRIEALRHEKGKRLSVADIAVANFLSIRNHLASQPLKAAS